MLVCVFNLSLLSFSSCWHSVRFLFGDTGMRSGSCANNIIYDVPSVVLLASFCSDLPARRAQAFLELPTAGALTLRD